MKTGVFVAVLAVALASAAGAETFQQILGSEQVVAVVQDETKAFTDQFYVMTERRIEVAGSFYPAVIEPILGTEALGERATAELLLRARFGKFLAGLAAFLLATESRLVFARDEAYKYLSAARKARRCREVPCARGCAENPCDLKCDPCR